jgi:hypothetical protein
MWDCGIKKEIWQDTKFQNAISGLDKPNACLSLLLRQYTQTKSYCQAIISKKYRVDLAGNKIAIKNTHIIDAKNRLAHKKPFRRKKRFIPPIKKPNNCKLIGNLNEQGIIIKEEPCDIQNTPNKWLVFFVKADNRIIKIKLKPKFFSKLQTILVESHQVLIVGRLNTRKSLKPFHKYVTVRKLRV